MQLLRPAPLSRKGETAKAMKKHIVTRTKVSAKNLLKRWAKKNEGQVMVTVLQNVWSK
jgi:hypothetical protein